MDMTSNTLHGSSSSGESKAKLPDLPLDIIVNIISRLPLKLIIGCKFLSKPFNTSISHPSFNNLYVTNNISTYFHSILVHDSYFDPESISLDLLEFPRQDIYKDNPKFKINKFTHFNLGIVSIKHFSIWGYCNGLFCFLKIKLEGGPFNLFLTNPILGEFLKLPVPVTTSDEFLAYGLGHCKLTNKYKVLIITTSYEAGGYFQNVSYILTIGTDKEWRSVSDVNVPCNFMWGQLHGNPQAHMVAFSSALHWIVGPIPVYKNSIFGPHLEGKTYICAFDMTEEKVTAILVPPEVAAAKCFYGQLIILFDKLCLWQHLGVLAVYGEIDGFALWVMDQYGVEESWTKKFTIEVSSLPKYIKHSRLRPLTLSPEGLIMLSECHKFVIYDSKKNECLKVIHQTDDHSYPILFVPSFLSIGTWGSCSRLMIDALPWFLNLKQGNNTLHEV